MTQAAGSWTYRTSSRVEIAKFADDAAVVVVREVGVIDDNAARLGLAHHHATVAIVHEALRTIVFLHLDEATGTVVATRHGLFDLSVAVEINFRRNHPDRRRDGLAGMLA
jgi:hypothetical protein